MINNIKDDLEFVQSETWPIKLSPKSKVLWSDTMSYDHEQQKWVNPLKNLSIRNAKKKLFSSFAVTVTLNPRYAQCVTYQEQYSFCEQFVLKEVSKYPTSIEKMHLSFELTKNNNIHMHIALKTGMEMTRGAAKELMIIFFSSPFFGFLDVKPCYNEQGWLNYIQKGEYFQEQHLYAFA